MISSEGERLNIIQQRTLAKTAEETEELRSRKKGIVSCGEPSVKENQREAKTHWFKIKNGGGRWIRTIEVSDSRFTVCPLWPLGKSSTLELVIGIEPTTC